MKINFLNVAHGINYFEVFAFFFYLFFLLIEQKRDRVSTLALIKF